MQMSSAMAPLLLAMIIALAQTGCSVDPFINQFKNCCQSCDGIVWVPVVAPLLHDQ